MKDSNYFVVCGWMANRLKLKGNELMLFAIVYGFSQAEGTWYTGTHGYLAEMIGGADLKTVRAALSSLERKGYIQRKEEERNGVRLCLYRASDDVREFLPDIGKNSLPLGKNSLPLGKNSLPPGEKFPTPLGKNPLPPGEKFPPIVKEDNKINNNEDSESTRAPACDNAPSCLAVPYPTKPSEVVDVATRQGRPMTEKQAQEFIDYYSATGWMMRGTRITDWRHKVGGWCDRQQEIDARKKAQPTAFRQSPILTERQDYGPTQRGYGGLRK